MRMADEQPGHINRDVRDITNVPQAEDLVRNNVGSTVRDNSNFKAVSEVRVVAPGMRFEQQAAA